MTDAQISTVVRSFKYRLLPSKGQHRVLERILEDQRILYNAALTERIDYYRRTGKSRSYMDQCKALTECRHDIPEMSDLPLNIQRWTLKRLDDAFAAFFRRAKAKGGKAGFPRYRGKGHWRSFGFAEFSGVRLDGNRLRFAGTGVRVHIHRSPPDSKPLSCTISRDHKGWHVSIQYMVPVQMLPSTGREVGIDMGLKELCVLSTGESIPNPRSARVAEKEMSRRQRALARCQRGSNRRRKVKQAVTRLHAKIVNQRMYYLHKVSSRLVRGNDMIAIENLNVKGMARSMLARSVHDASWSKLREMIAYKAEGAGRELVVVDPKYTSQTCPECGQVKAKALSERTHKCDCGCVMDRDHAAALVILERGRDCSRASQRKELSYAWHRKRRLVERQVCKSPWF